ncbi:uncharacterized protein LOC114932808 [Nylanderia fulva]|uniref:uncharacterized protein LOC114932808 n=1 Tax=Nylanderia fulva TaxID=613905 RepID=UPI0010FB98CD|nr:uncharacterized protein LOC114932808 [Nylanderia fulva]
MPGDTLKLPTDQSRNRTRSQGSIIALLVVQREYLRSIHRTCNSAVRLTETSASITVSTKLQTLTQLWAKCRCNHEELTAYSIDPDVSDYLKGTEFGDMEDRVLDATDALTALQSNMPSTSSIRRDAADASSTSRFTSLERIPLPTFNGDQKDWAHFRDMFDSMVVRESGLSNVQKFYYLKSCLTGTALSLIKNLPITDANFESAWKLINDHYQDIQVLTFSLIVRLLKLRPVSGDSPAALETLVNQTREILVSLENLNQLSWDSILVVMTLMRLDPTIRKSWEENIGKRETFPNYDELEQFLNGKIHALNVASIKSGVTCLNDNAVTKNSKHKNGVDSKVTSHVANTNTSVCHLCSAAHNISKCAKFKVMSASERLDSARAAHLCFNCLAKGHFPPSCKNKPGCDKCKKRHHKMLHQAFSPRTSDPESINSNAVTSVSSNDHAKLSNVTSCHSGVAKSKTLRPVLIATAWVHVRTAEGRELPFRAVIDSGSECSLISEAAAQALRVQRIACSASISGTGATVSGVVKHSTRVELRSRNKSQLVVVIEPLILSRLSNYVPRRFVKASEWTGVGQLTLADPDPCSDKPIDLILGADCYDEIILQDRVKFPGEPYAIHSRFGWVLRGPVDDGPVNVSSSHTTISSLHVTPNTDLTRAIERFWEVEEIPSQTQLSAEDQYCEDLFVATTNRDTSGRYNVALPFKGNLPIDIGDSHKNSLRMYASLERRLKKDRQLAVEYNDFLNEYLRLGHMSPYTPTDVEEQRCFIPHHPVLKPSSTSTKVRVVFNASARTGNGKSLNDCLLIGPKLQTDLCAILLRWRWHRFVCAADIAKMFRQIRVHDDHTRFQLILWRQSEKDAVIPYRLRTVTYGTAPAPFLALRVLRQLAEDEKHRFPLAAHNVIFNSYVDDIFFGASEIEECREIREQMIGLTNAGGFPLHKWSSNCPDLISDLSETIRDPAQNVDFKEDDQLKILGIYWAPLEDAFSFRICAEVPSHITKRTFLSYISRIYDPLGWLSPVIIIGKILIQQLWLSRIDWDTTLPSDLNERCISFCHGLISLATVCIPRWVHSREDSSIEIHGFADASQAAYAAVIYLRVIHKFEPQVFLLTSKSKVAPLKTVSVPRLELCAAELLSRLLAWTISALNLEQVPIYAWTDSTVALAWLSKSPATWKVFVANRVSLIQTQCPQASWRHVPTQDNPADLASRGVSPTQLIKNPLWWYGPSWLFCEPQEWPSVDSSDSLPTSDLEARSVVTHVTNVSEWDLSTRYSDWSKLLKITALILRFVKLTRRQLPCTELLYTTRLMTEAKTFWIKVIQSSLYATELHLLRAEQRLPRSSSLLSLDPFIDDDGIIRMGGRLMHAPLTFAQKHPVILSQTPLTRIIVRDAHLRTLHGGTSLTLRLLREEYWILRAKIIVRSVIGQCVICSRHRANLSSQKMAHLPEIRTNVARPFLKVGVDYAGPLPVRAFAGRGHQSRKAYIALFVCLITRAVHIELVTDLSSAAFIAAFRRFCSRRGIPAIVLSDNGTNFRGAQTELYRIFHASMCDGAVESSMASLGIEWRFIPASAPHLAGFGKLE